MYDCPPHATLMIQIQIDRLLMCAASDGIHAKIHVSIYTYIQCSPWRQILFILDDKLNLYDHLIAIVRCITWIRCFLAICRRCQHCKNPSGDKKKSDEVTIEPIKHNSNERGNEAKKYMQHDSKQSNRKGKITNQVRLTVLVLRSEGNIRKQEGKEQMSAIIVAAMIMKGKAVHSVHSIYQ